MDGYWGGRIVTSTCAVANDLYKDPGFMPMWKTKEYWECQWCGSKLEKKEKCKQCGGPNDR